MDFRETFREIYAGLVYMWHRMRGVETDPVARRIAVLKHALDKSRAEIGHGRPGEVKGPVLEIDTTVEVAVDGATRHVKVARQLIRGDVAAAGQAQQDAQRPFDARHALNMTQPW